MNAKKSLTLTLVLLALIAFVAPAPAASTDDGKDLSVYFRPAVRFGTDNRTLFIMDLLVPVYRGNKDLLFINAKFTPDDHDAWETNAGIGYRRLVLDDKLVLGGNFFYDHRRTAYGSDFDQLGLGVEAMTELNGIGLTGRINYYQPLTKARLGEGFGYVFYGNGIYSAGVEEPMTGFDYEAGVRIPWVSNYVETWAYAGGYHFFGSHVEDVNGFSARIEAFPTDFLRLNFEYRNDTVNLSEYYGEVAFEVPFSIDNLIAGKNPFEGIGHVLTGSRSLKERMVEPVHRDVDIVVGKDYLSGPDAAGDGDLAAGVIFVADNAAPGGDGSYEHPYDNLASATGDARLGNTISIVHILKGDGAGLAGDDFFQDGITIWGAGANNPVYPYVTNFAQGYPTVITPLYLGGANMTLLGVSFDVSDYAAVSVGGNAFESGLQIFANRIYNQGQYGIYFEGPDGIGTPATPVNISNNYISIDGGSIARGIHLQSYDGDIYALIRNNRIKELWSDDVAEGISVDASNGSFYGDISGNTISDINGADDVCGIRIDAYTSLNGTISRNVITDVYGNETAMGIDPDTEGDFNAVIADNDLSDIGAYDYASGIDLDVYNFNGVITRNRINGIFADNYDWYSASAYGIFLNADNELNGAITDNTIYDIYSYSSDEDGESYGIYAYTEGDFGASISGNTVGLIEACGGWDTLAAGIYAYADYGDFRGSISRNAISEVWAEDAYGEAEAYGILAVTDGYFTGSISGNSIRSVWAEYSDDDDVYAAGIYWGTGNDFTGSISNNTIADIWASDAYEDAEAYGIDGYMDGGNFTGSISGNTISAIRAGDANYSVASGIYTYLWDGDFLGSISGNTISTIEAGDAEDAEASGIYTYLWDGDFLGTISGNTISSVVTEDTGYGWSAGISGETDYGLFAGTITGNTATGISSTDYAAGIDLSIFMGVIAPSITGNRLEVAGGYEAYGLYVDASYPGGSTIGTAASPLVFTSNSGTLTGATIYMAYLDANDPGGSNVLIGYHANPNMKNDFTGTGTWGGNYPGGNYPAGRIWASGYPTYIFVHP